MSCIIINEMASIDRQLRVSTQIHNAFDNFRKLGKAKMTEGACTTRLTRLKELWSKFEADHFELVDDEEIDSKDNYFTTDVYIVKWMKPT